MKTLKKTVIKTTSSWIEFFFHDNKTDISPRLFVFYNGKNETKIIEKVLYI